MSIHYETLECGCSVTCDNGGGGAIKGKDCDGKNCKVPEYFKKHNVLYGFCKNCNPEEYKEAIDLYGDYTEGDKDGTL